MRTFCTIITGNYFSYAATLYESLIRISPEEKLHVLVCDDALLNPDPVRYRGITVTRINELYGYGNTDSIFHKYAEDADALRWSMKPVFMNYLLDHGFDKVLFVDCDIFFFNDYNFLFAELDSSNVLLTLHRTTTNPNVNEEDFLSFFKYGMFNAGFVGASLQGIPALQWWSRACAFRNEVNIASGIYKDQRYLDAIPVLFDKVKVIDHRGCNIAFWNQQECERSIVNSQLLINKKYPVIFIHFTRKYIPELLEGHDSLILPYFREYEKCFQKTGYQLSDFISGLPEYKKPGPLLSLKRRLRIRTRIKNWLFRLSQ